MSHLHLSKPKVVVVLIEKLDRGKRGHGLVRDETCPGSRVVTDVVRRLRSNKVICVSFLYIHPYQ